MKLLTLFSTALMTLLLLSPQSFAEIWTLDDPLFHQGLINENNFHTIDMLGRNYPKRNTINPVWLGIFRTYNSSETAQNRTALSSKLSDTQLIFDMVFNKPVDWSKVTLDENNEANLDPSQYALALETTHIQDENSPIFLMLLSNQHVILDYLSNNAQNQLTQRGASVAVLEYPGYGVSIGISNKKNWLKAVKGASQFLHELTGRKIYLVGHSVGGPLALEAASLEGMGNYVAGAISYGGFTDIYEMASDHIDNRFLKKISKGVVRVSGDNNNIDGLSKLNDLIDNGVKALIMHGEYDNAVTPKHLRLYENKVSQLNDRGYASENITTHLFEELFHEEINNYSEFAKDGFNQVWNKIYTTFGL